MNMFVGLSRHVGRIGALFVVAVLGMAGAVHAESYTALPVRTIGPFVAGQTAPAPSGGWTAADDRSIGQSIGGQDGWIASATQPTRLDNEIAAGDGRFNSQAWRVSNWYHDGVVNHFLSPAFGVTGEAGSSNDVGDPALGNHVVYEFWFLAPSSANAGAQVSTSLTDAPGRRMTYVDLRDDSGAVTLRTVGISNSAGTAGSPPFDDAPYVVNTSPALQRGEWYRVVIDAMFVDGQDNDQVSVDLYAADGAQVWSVANAYSWEPAYWDGLFSASGTLVAVDHAGFRVVENPDFSDRRDGNTYSATNRPHGFYFDDMSMVPDVGTSFTTGFESDRWVSAAGGADSSDCSVQASPCATIEYAIGQSASYDTIHIAGGTYADESLTVNLDGLRLIGEDPNNKPVIARQTGGTNQPLLVIVDAQDVHVENLEFAMDQSFVAEGILAGGFVDGLTISGNDFFTSRSSSSVNSNYSWRNAIAINYGNNSQILTRVDGSTVTVDGNTIDSVTNNLNGAFLRAGIQMDAGNGSIVNNIVTAGVHDIVVRFATATGASTGDTVSIEGNQTFGRGLEFDSPNASITQVTISNNALHAPSWINDATSYPADFSLARLIDNAAGVPTTLTGNAFSGHQGDFRGVLVENYPGIVLDANTFAPAPGAADFVSLVISNKEITTNSPPQPPLAISMTAQGNSFVGSGVVGAGTAVELLNDNDAGGAATFGSLLFGGSGPGEANTFDGDLRWYFHLDDYNCETVNTPTCGFLDYAGTIGDNSGTNTDVRPFSGNVSAAGNLYDGIAPSAMDASQQNALFARTYDSSANPALGTVDYGLAATALATFVDDDFSGSYGDPLTFSSGAPGCPSQTVYFGLNAFATIPEGISHVDSAGTVCVAKGSYADSVTINKHVKLIGDGNTAVDTVVDAGIVIAASGVDSGDPLLLANLRVSNATGYGVSASGSHLAFDSVAFTGSSQSGLNFSAIADDVEIANSLFAGNGDFGIRTSTTAKVSNLAITGSTFTGNSAGIVLFGGSGSGDGQITSWSIDNTQFASNDSADATPWGGGIWIKTGGAGSTIDGFSVTNSVFADNGSSNTLNQVGITVRARPGTTMRNVSICTNTFTENTGIPGTQLTGINVFDDTANNGYSPIVVCADNVFNNLAHSISGLEQFTLRGTQPVVDITGGSIANTEHINSPVVRVRDGAEFPTITLAMNDTGTLAGDEIHAPAGLYHENVVVSHDDMTLSGDGAGTVIDGAGLSGNGVTLPGGRVGVTLSDFTVQNFTSIGSGGGCIFGSSGNDNTTVTGTTVTNCKSGRGGIFFNGPIDALSIDNNDVSDADGRGILVWNGFKTNITITNNHVHDLTGCCGIELQDGTASGVTVTGNVVENTGDSGMAFIGLTSGAGANLIDNNTINNTGRFGIEIKLPNGTGLESGDGSIVLSNNLVTRPAIPTSTDQRDVGGIVVIRRGFCPTCGETDITTGVVVKNNTVSGWVPANGSLNDGFGIVVEGTNMHVYGNTVSGNDIGVQLQVGNDGYPGDSNQVATNDFFSRGNAQATCVDLGSNILSGNNIDSRSISNPAGLMLAGGVHNQTQGTYFCSIQTAIDDSATVAGDVITVDAGTYAENVTVNKGITLQGAFAGTAGYDASRDGTGESVISPATGRAVRIINTSNVVFDGFTIQNVNDTAISSGANYGGPSDTVAVLNNRILDVHDGSGLYTNGPPGTVANWTVSGNLVRNIESPFGSGVNLWSVTGGTISGNVVEDSAFGGIQTVESTDVEISGNTIDNTAHNGVNVASSSNIRVFGNTITDANTSGTGTEAGLTLYGGTSDVVMFCNSVSGSGVNGFSTSTGITDPYSNIRVFDNALSVVSSVSHNLPGAITIGSNWYGGGAPSVTGSNAAGAQIADPLAATPIGTDICNNPDPATANDPAQILVAGGSAQSTPVNTTFADPLEARVVDALGGAVMGEAVSFTAPASGASATLGSPSGSTDFNGTVSTSATANGIGGSYDVTASSGSLIPATFALTNERIAGSVTWDELTWVYDGATHTPTVHITEEPSASCTVTPATVGPDAGDYPVHADCVGDSYIASGDAVATITPAPAEVTLSNLVQQYDGSPKPVTVTTSPPDIAVEVTYDGSTTAPSAVGEYAVVATVTDPNYTGSASGTLQIVEADAADLAVSITDDREYQQYGELLTYTITVSNIGNTDITGASVDSVLPAELEHADPSWTCIPVGTATCTASGAGDLHDTVDIPAGGGVAYLFNAWVRDDQGLATESLVTTVTVTATGDTDTSNDSATDMTQAVIFRDGFENGGDGAEWLLGAGAAVEIGRIDVNRSAVLDLIADAADGYIFNVVTVRGSNGDRIAVQAVRVDGMILVRMSGHSDGAAQVTRWTVARAGVERLALGVVTDKDGYWLLLVGGAEDLQLPLFSGAVLGISTAPLPGN